MSDPSIMAMPPDDDWRRLIVDERMRAHIAFAQAYARDFHHGAPGHLDLMTIATLAGLLDRAQREGAQTE